jgi:hypothetical protein
MADYFHELFAAGLIRGFNQYGPHGMNAEGLAVLLLFFDEVVVAAKLLEHVRHDHAASVSLIAEVGQLLTLDAVGKAQRKKGIGLDRHSLGLVKLLPEELAAHF